MLWNKLLLWFVSDILIDPVITVDLFTASVIRNNIIPFDQKAFCQEVLSLQLFKDALTESSSFLPVTFWKRDFSASIWASSDQDGSAWCPGDAEPGLFPNKNKKCKTQKLFFRKYYLYCGVKSDHTLLNKT